MALNPLLIFSILGLLCAGCSSKKNNFAGDDLTYTGSGFSLNTEAVQFQDTLIGESDDRGFFVTNDGGNQTSIGLSHACAKTFQIKSSNCFFLEPGSSNCMVDVTFNPVSAKVHSCSLTVSNAEGDQKTLLIKGKGMLK
ncbi:MAG TPA: hypothetical protein VNJ01_11225 [Bacteriovoracaceae bacterium]|nr:hypothetical protein [Bacteriovoracaceae bacterium]